MTPALWRPGAPLLDSDEAAALEDLTPTPAPAPDPWRATVTTTITHQPGCPETQAGGSALGPCLCVGGRPFATRPAPTRFQLSSAGMPGQLGGPRRIGARVGDSHRKATVRRGPTNEERAAASAALAAVGLRWIHAYQWAVDTQQPGVEQLHKASLHPPTAEAFLAAMHEPATGPAVVDVPVTGGVL